MSSWLQSSSTSWVTHRAQGAGAPNVVQSWGQSCARRCRCSGAGGCRCTSRCRTVAPPRASGWAAAPPSARATFDDVGYAGELGRSGRRWYRPLPAYGGRFGGGSRSFSSRQHRWRLLAARMRRLRATRVRRTLRLNQTFATRLGWGRHAHRIARALNSPSANPWSLGFARAVARWQRRSGLSVDGVLSPRAWMQLQSQLGPDPMSVPPPQDPMSAGLEPGSTAPPMAPPADGLDMASAPPDGADDPAAAMPGGPDAAMPDAPADEPAGEWSSAGGWGRW